MSENNQENNYSIDFMISEYIDLTIFLTQLENIDTKYLLSQLYTYLKCLTSNDAEQLLPELQLQLHSPFSWLAKANIINQLAEKTVLIEKFLTIQDNNTVEYQALKTLLTDAKRRIEYFNKLTSQQCIDDICQIYNGVHILFNDQLPLNEVKDEVASYLTEREIPYTAELPSEQYLAFLKKLHASSLVNSIRILAKQTKPLPIQTELFLKKYNASQGTYNNTKDNAKLTIQFQANQQYVEHIMALNQSLLNSARELLTEQMANRLSKKISALVLARVLQNYAEAEKNNNLNAEVKPQSDQTTKPNQNLSPSEDQNHDHSKPNNKIDTKPKMPAEPAKAPDKEAPKKSVIAAKLAEQEAKEAARLKAEQEEQLRLERIRKEQLAAEQQAENLRRAQQESQALDESIARAEQVINSVNTHINQFQLMQQCAQKFIQCYARANLLQQLQTNFNSVFEVQQTELNSILAVMEKPIPWQSLGLTQVQEQEFQTLQKSARTDVLASLQTIDDYQAQSNSSNHSAETNNWQAANLKLLISADTEKLASILDYLTQIASMENPALKAILVIYFSKIYHKLSAALINNMASWSSRKAVSQSVVTNTLNYLGIKLNQQHLAKISPHIKFEQRQINKTNQQASITKPSRFRESALYGLLEDWYFACVNCVENITDWFQGIKLFQRR